MLSSFPKTFENPFQALREFDRVVNRVWDKVDDGVASVGFLVDIVEENDQLVVTADLPGYAKDQIDISVEQGVLSIEAQRHKIEPSAEAKTYAHERRTTRVSRRFTLPTAYDTTDVDATLADGVLTLKLAKREESKPRKVEVK